MIPAPHTIAREAYRLWRDRGIAPDETFRAWLEAEGYTPEYRADNAAYRRAYSQLAKAWAAQLAEARLDGRACSYCGALLPAHRAWLCDGDTCHYMGRGWMEPLPMAA